MGSGSSRGEESDIEGDGGRRKKRCCRKGGDEEDGEKTGCCGGGGGSRCSRRGEEDGEEGDEVSPRGCCLSGCRDEGGCCRPACGRSGEEAGCCSRGCPTCCRCGDPSCCGKCCTSPSCSFCANTACCKKCQNCCECCTCCASPSCCPLSPCCKKSACCPRHSSDIETSSDAGSPSHGGAGANHDKKKLGSFDSETQVTIQEDVVRSRREKCVSCCKKFVAFLFSTIGLCTVLVAYTIFGGFIFMKLESPNERLLKSDIKNMRKFTAELLWNKTYEMNVFYPENWTDMAEKILFDFTMEVYDATKRKGWDGSDGEAELQWTFAGSMLYSVTVITTIGYGHIAPRTDWGRIVTILYAIIGIPLTLLTLTNLGGFMATAFRFLYKNICCGLCCICCQKPDGKVKSSVAKYKDAENGDPGASKSLTDELDSTGEPVASPTKKYSVRVYWRHGIQRIFKTEDNKRVTVPIYVSLLIIATYILIGALIFTIWEADSGWDFLIGSYFCFITLTTIGFGDYVPGTSVDSWAAQQKLILCALYVVFGLALITMCFDLMQEEVRAKCRALGQKLGLIAKDKK